MADYHPLIARAVAGLENNTGEGRRVLYERARTALVNQLRSVEPPLDEADITRERLALEEAIRKVEAEAAAAAPPPAEPAPSPLPPPVAEPAPAPSPSLRDQGLRNFRDTVAEAESLGGATSEAKSAAREVYRAMPGTTPAKPAAAAGGTHFFEPPGEHAGDAGEPTPDEVLGEAADRRMPPAPYTHEEDEDDDDDYGKPPRSWGKLIAVLVLLLAVAGIAGAAYWQRAPIATMIASLRNSAPSSAPKEAPSQPAAKPKISDRVAPAPGSGGAAPATAPAAAVAQKVVLYDEDPNNPQGKRYVGSAIWRTETVSPGPGLAPELAVRADVDVPERHLRMTFSLRRNSDKALPASHTIEIMFTLPADFDQGGIGNVPGVLMKPSEEARGVPLAGLAVKVTNGYYLIGLSSVDIDLQRNIDLLKNRDWFDIPIVYTSGKRAILALEKGTPGQRAFEEAFRAWGQ
jgi:hypothetical protein